MRHIVAILFTAILLFGCGGGGGGGSSLHPAEMTPSAPVEPPPPEISTRDIQTSDPEEILDEAARAANSRPRFGSVFQSNETLTGISSSFNGQRLTVSAQRAAGGPIRLDTAKAVEDQGVGPSILGLEGRSGRDWGVIDISGSADTSFSITIGRVAVDWADGNTNDYLAGGYWLNVEGNVLAGEVTNVGVGAFIDGPEIDSSNPATLPIQGTASYRGTAAGMYAIIYGTEALSSGFSVGSAAVGEFSGIAKLTADFGNMTISGCVGCDGGILLSGAAQDGVTGRTVGFYSVPSDFEVRLGAAPISNDGSFTQNNVTATSQDTPVRNSSGSWGGRFSSIQDAEGDPRLVAGTFGGEFSTHGGSDAVFLGAFGAGKQ